MQTVKFINYTLEGMRNSQTMVWTADYLKYFINANGLTNIVWMTLYGAFYNVKKKEGFDA